MPSIPFTGAPPPGPLVPGAMVVWMGDVVPYQVPPTAAFSPDPQFGILGSVVRLDGRASRDENNAPLTFKWSFVSVPVGSRVETEGFRLLEEDGEVVSFSPDVVGEYVVRLIVSNGVFDSVPAVSSVSIRAILVPHGRGLVPDGKFIWSYIRDVWSQVEGREWFETLWSTLIQLVGNDMLQLYQNDFNKSIRDIQDLYQRRWLSYEPKLPLAVDDLSFYLGNHLVGSDATTGSVGVTGLAIIFSSNELVVYSGKVSPDVVGKFVDVQTSLSSSNLGSFQIEGLNVSRTGYKLLGAPLNAAPDTIINNLAIDFSFQSKNWEIDAAVPSGTVALIAEGDIIRYATGPNAGYYRVISRSGYSLVMDRKPVGASDLTLATVHRPVSINIAQADEALSDTISVGLGTAGSLPSVVPGRLFLVGNRAFTIDRVSTDPNQQVPLAVITADEKVVASGLKSQFWRVPHTLVSKSQNFEQLGVSVGDLMLVDVVREDIQTTARVVAQVVGVDRTRLGFVLTDEAVVGGEIPDIPNKTYLELSQKLGLPSVTTQQDGTLAFASVADELLTVLESGRFGRDYFNRELTASTEISAGGYKFTLHPKIIIRNRLVPIAEELRSIPVLQQFISQPTIVEEGGKVFQLHKGERYELKTRPAFLTENLDFIIDAEYALDGELNFKTGQKLIEADDGDFIDRGVESGDVFIIDEPVTLAGEYLIESVPSRTQIQLTRAVPTYVLSEVVTAKVRITRRRSGHFLRFTPKAFSAKNPAPDRLWGEVSFFDNSEAIENNFGILVALKKADLDSISTSINYRQAVAGLMFAYTKGSSIDRVRLGVQILLGLPFTEHRGIVRSIEEDYRLNIQGTPVLGRILIEDVDNTGAPLGTQRVYTYPVDLQSEIAGIETNPSTGKKYVVGDVVEIFQPLAKGVKVDDYLTSPLEASFSPETFLQQYHSIRVNINDNIFGLDELDLVSNFLKKITPAYISYSIVMASEFVDVVNITDVLRNGFRIADGALVDNASLSIPPTLMFDSKSFGHQAPQMLLGDGVYWIRRTGKDMVTVNASSTVQVPSGGFINPRSNELFQAPLTKVGDVLVIEGGINGGRYPITAVLSDSQVTVDGPAQGFESGSSQSFHVARRITHILQTGSTTATSANNTLQVENTKPLRTNGVAAGDWLILSDGALSSRHLIRKVKEQNVDSGVWNQVEVVPAPTSSGVKTYLILRPALLPSGVDEYEIVADGTSNTILPSDEALTSVLQTHDRLVIVGAENEFQYTVLDPKNLYVTPPMPAGTHQVRIIRPGHAGVENISWDHIEIFDPRDEIDATIISSVASITCTAASDIVSFTGHNPRTMGFRPGDLLTVSSGGNSTVDVGYGLGVYPIVGVTTSTVKLSVPLTASGTASWKVTRRT